MPSLFKLFLLLLLLLPPPPPPFPSPSPSPSHSPFLPPPFPYLFLSYLIFLILLSVVAVRGVAKTLTISYSPLEEDNGRITPASGACVYVRVRVCACVCVCVCARAGVTTTTTTIYNLFFPSFLPNRYVRLPFSRLHFHDLPPSRKSSDSNQKIQR